MDRWNRQPPQWAALLLLMVTFAGADILLNTFAIGLGWTILWPINGVTIALLLRTPRRKWPWLLLAVEVGTAIGETATGNKFSREICERLASTFEVVLSAMLLPSFATVEEWLGRPRVVRRVLAALVLGPGVSGLFAAVFLHFLAHETYTSAWNWWATPDMLGIAVTLPVALMLRTPEMRELLTARRVGRTLGILALSVAVAVLIFSFQAYPLLFLLYPMLLYVDWKLSFAGASVTLFLSSVVGVFCTVHGVGPFGHWLPSLALSRESALQIYIGFHAVALLPLSLVMMERKNIANQLREANARLRAIARQDPLTGMPNRRAFDEGFADAWQHAASAGKPLSALMLDIDHFKQFNDRYGHLAGDDCLVRVAHALRAVVGDETRVARFGGEEFVVLVPGGVQACFQLAECLRRGVVGAAIPHEDSDWGLVTISVGCATVLPAMGGERRTLLAEADAALYQAKERGRNQLGSALTTGRDLRLVHEDFCDDQRRRETTDSLLQAVLLPTIS